MPLLINRIVNHSNTCPSEHKISYLYGSGTPNRYYPSIMKSVRIGIDSLRGHQVISIWMKFSKTHKPARFMFTIWSVRIRELTSETLTRRQIIFKVFFFGIHGSSKSSNNWTQIGAVECALVSVDWSLLYILLVASVCRTWLDYEHQTWNNIVTQWKSSSFSSIGNIWPTSLASNPNVIQISLEAK